MRFQLTSGSWVDFEKCQAVMLLSMGTLEPVDSFLTLLHSNVTCLFSNGTA